MLHAGVWMVPSGACLQGEYPIPPRRSLKTSEKHIIFFPRLQGHVPFWYWIVLSEPEVWNKRHRESSSFYPEWNLKFHLALRSSYDQCLPWIGTKVTRSFQHESLNFGDSKILLGLRNVCKYCWNGVSVIREHLRSGGHQHEPPQSTIIGIDS